MYVPRQWVSVSSGPSKQPATTKVPLGPAMPVSAASRAPNSSQTTARHPTSHSTANPPTARQNHVRPVHPMRRPPSPGHRSEDALPGGGAAEPHLLRRRDGRPQRRQGPVPVGSTSLRHGRSQLPCQAQLSRPEGTGHDRAPCLRGVRGQGARWCVSVSVSVSVSGRLLVRGPHRLQVRLRCRRAGPRRSGRAGGVPGARGGECRLLLRRRGDAVVVRVVRHE